MPVRPTKTGDPTMKIETGAVGLERAIIELFVKTFSASEGADEGAQIGGLVHELLTQTPIEDIRIFRAEEEDVLACAAIFTRLAYADDPHIVFLLSPMAVAPERQRQGIGQDLLSEALQGSRTEGVQIALTYGDPNYYGRVGFMPITETQARPPCRSACPMDG